MLILILSIEGVRIRIKIKIKIRSRSVISYRGWSFAATAQLIEAVEKRRRNAQNVENENEEINRARPIASIFFERARTAYDLLAQLHHATATTELLVKLSVFQNR